MATTYTGYEDLTVAGSAIGFTTATFGGAANRAIVLVEVAPVRFTLDGTTPTASVGDTLEIGDRLILDGRDQVLRVKFIRREGTSATLRCTYGVE